MDASFVEVQSNELFVGTYSSFAGVQKTELFLKLGEKAGSQSYNKVRRRRNGNLELTAGTVTHFFEAGDRVSRLNMEVK